MPHQRVLGPALRFVCLTFAIALLSLLLATEKAEAKARLMTLTDGVIAYSGPGQFYRPLSVFPARTEIRAGSKIITNKNGAFYRVLVVLSSKKKAVGFVSVQANVRYVDDKLEEDDLEKYGEVALVNKAVQVAFSTLQRKSSMINLGYMHYLSPGFYVKGYGGQFSDDQDSAYLAGGEIGNDALLFNKVSGLVSFGLGLFSAQTAGTIFEGSTKLDAHMMASVGARYNFGGSASVSLAATQAVLFNANNSLVTRGATFTVEVGL